MSATSATFHSAWTRRRLWGFIAAPTVSAVSIASPFWLLGTSPDRVQLLAIVVLVPSGLVMIALGLMGLRNLGRFPVLQVTADAVEYGSICYPQRSMRRLARSEVRRVVASSDLRVVVETVSGARRKIRLRELRPDERPAARQAIERLFAPA